MKNLDELILSLSRLLSGKSPLASVISFILALASLSIGLLTLYYTNVYKNPIYFAMGLLIVLCGCALLYSSLVALSPKLKMIIQTSTAGTISYGMFQLSSDIGAKEIAIGALFVFSLLWIWMWRLEKKCLGKSL